MTSFLVERPFCDHLQLFLGRLETPKDIPNSSLRNNFHRFFVFFHLQFFFVYLLKIENVMYRANESRAYMKR